MQRAASLVRCALALNTFPDGCGVVVITRTANVHTRRAGINVHTTMSLVDNSDTLRRQIEFDLEHDRKLSFVPRDTRASLDEMWRDSMANADGVLMMQGWPHTNTGLSESALVGAAVRASSRALVFKNQSTGKLTVHAATAVMNPGDDVDDAIRDLCFSACPVPLDFIPTADEVLGPRNNQYADAYDVRDYERV